MHLEVLLPSDSHFFFYKTKVHLSLAMQSPNMNYLWDIQNKFSLVIKFPEPDIIKPDVI